MAMVVRKGDPDAGTIFVKTRRPDGAAALYGPTPETDEGIRRWRMLMAEAEGAEPAVDTRLAREIEFDPDLWVIEIEDREGRHFLGDFLDRA